MPCKRLSVTSWQISLVSVQEVHTIVKLQLPALTDKGAPAYSRKEKDLICVKFLFQTPHVQLFTTLLGFVLSCFKSKRPPRQTGGSRKWAFWLEGKLCGGELLKEETAAFCIMETQASGLTIKCHISAKKKTLQLPRRPCGSVVFFCQRRWCRSIGL